MSYLLHDLPPRPESANFVAPRRTASSFISMGLRLSNIFHDVSSNGCNPRTSAVLFHAATVSSHPAFMAARRMRMNLVVFPISTPAR